MSTSTKPATKRACNPDCRLTPLMSPFINSDYSDEKPRLRRNWSFPGYISHAMKDVKAGQKDVPPSCLECGIWCTGDTSPGEPSPAGDLHKVASSEPAVVDTIPDAADKISAQAGSNSVDKSSDGASSDPVERSPTKADSGAVRASVGPSMLRTFGSSHGKVVTSNEKIERLYQEGTSCETLADWAKSEAKAFLPTPVTGQAAVQNPVEPASTLSTVLRGYACSQMHAMVSLHCQDATWERWFEAVTMFDIYCCRRQRIADAPAMAELTVLCAAIVRLVKKNDSQQHAPAQVFCSNAVQFGHWLNGSGISAPTTYITEKQLALAEREVLDMLEWNINKPTVCSWTMAFFSRLNTLSGSKYQQSLAWMWPILLNQMHQLAMMKECSANLPPRSVASGLFSLGLVNARLLPEKVVSPEPISDAAVRQVILPHAPPAEAEQPRLPCDSSQQLLDLLEIATGSSLRELQEDCKAVVAAGQASTELRREHQTGSVSLCTNHQTNRTIL